MEGARKGNSYLNWKQNSNDRFTDLWWGYGAGERFTSWDQIYYNSIYIGRGSVLGDYNYERIGTVMVGLMNWTNIL